MKTTTGVSFDRYVRLAIMAKRVALPNNSAKDITKVERKFAHRAFAPFQPSLAFAPMVLLKTILPFLSNIFIARVDLTVKQ